MNNKQMKKVIKEACKLAKPFRVTDDNFRFKKIDPSDTLGLPEDKPRAKKEIVKGTPIPPISNAPETLLRQNNPLPLTRTQAPF